MAGGVNGLAGNDFAGLLLSRRVTHRLCPWSSLRSPHRGSEWNYELPWDINDRVNSES